MFQVCEAYSHTRRQISWKLLQVDLSTHKRKYGKVSQTVVYTSLGFSLSQVFHNKYSRLEGRFSGKKSYQGVNSWRNLWNERNLSNQTSPTSLCAYAEAFPR